MTRKQFNKEELYQKAIAEIKSKLENVKGDIIPKMATLVAVLKHTMPHYFWCGFYFAEEKELVVGPYQGSSACPNIAYTGVCGTSAKKKETVIVPNVHKFPGHITCDTHSKSEIVVPIIENGIVIGVFDVDAKTYNAFDETDKKYLEQLIPTLLED
mgnify:CR=1 FL=1